ncbi:MAG: MBL fold metallo-hydrolase [Gemmatimonadaceae bacterium]|nr:MBL fold metallo-hydrolase [Gemmatimonadaceae bacterium]
MSAFLVRGVLVDTGFPDAAGALARYVATARPDGCLVTHFHEDHSGGVAAVARAGVPVWMDARTADRVRRPKRIGFYRRYTWGSPSPVGAFTPFTPPASLECIATPGHSDDHHAVWERETGTLFGGDLFIGVKVRGSHASEQPRTLVRSLRQAITLRPQRLFDAHRGLVANPVALLTAKADWLEQTIASIDALIAEGLRDTVIARRVLGNDWFNRAFTVGDYTMRNLVRSARLTAPDTGPRDSGKISR